MFKTTLDEAGGAIDTTVSAAFKEPSKAWGSSTPSDLISGLAAVPGMLKDVVAQPFAYFNEQKSVQAATTREVTDYASNVIDDKVANGNMPTKEVFIDEVMQTKTAESVITNPKEVIILDPGQKIGDSLKEMEYYGRPDMVEVNKDYLGDLYDSFTDSKDSMDEFYKRNSSPIPQLSKIEKEQYDRLKKIQ